MTNGILGNELQQRRVAKIVCTFEDDPLPRQMRMLLQVSPQTCCISCIEKIDGPAKQGVLDSFMVRQFLGHWVFNSMPLHSSLTVTKKALGKQPK